MKILNNIIFYFKNLNKKSGYFYSLVLGCVYALSFAPIYFLPAAFIGLSFIFILFLKCENRKQLFWTGYWFGFGYFLVSIYWITISLFVEIETFWWLVPFSLFGIPAVLAVYFGLAFYLSGYVKIVGRKYKYILILAISLSIMEVLRLYLFTGFPWNFIGHSFVFSSEILQITGIIGIIGLSFLSSILFMLPSLFLLKPKASDVIFIIIVLGIIFAIYNYGSRRIDSYNESFYPQKFRIIQPNIAQTLKWDDNYGLVTLRKVINLISDNFDKETKIVILPESAIPFYINIDTDIVDYIYEFIPDDTILVAGSLRGIASSDGMIKQVWNSLYVIENSKIVDYYDKLHLVPFGEYIPLSSILPLRKITQGGIDFSSGEKVNYLNIDGLEVRALICYESIFPNEILYDHERPDILVNITNDDWFGKSSGPYQHLDISKVRAVEYGVPMIRVANSGISAIIDPLGRIITQAPLKEEAVIDSYIPEAIKEKTIYSKYSIYVLFLMWFAAIIIIEPRIFIRLKNIRFRFKK